MFQNASREGHWRAAANLCCALFFAASSSSALAHAGLARSSPRSRAVLDRPPSQIELCFNERVELKFSTVGLTGPNGDKLPLGALSVGESDPKCLRASAPELRDAGVYTVNYRVLSTDGHVVEYGFTFSYQPNTR
jgi:methionine-rich copper-binding protein CopC